MTRLEIICAVFASGGLTTLVQFIVTRIELRRSLAKRLDALEESFAEHRATLARTHILRFADEQREQIMEHYHITEDEFEIRVKTFPFKPMTPEEAILQMNLLGHSFFAFTDAELGDICVVYKRKAGSYGLIVPEK